MAITLRYSTPDRVARYMGATFSPAQLQEAEALLAAAEAWIDNRVGHAYAVGVVTAEAYWPAGPNLYLRSAPILSVQAVTARYSLFATPDVALVAGTSYEVRDLATGWLWLPYGPYDRVLVSYTTSSIIPQTVATGATMLAAHWLQQSSVGGVGLGITSYTVGQELSVTYSNAVQQYGVPVEVLTLIPAGWHFA